MSAMCVARRESKNVDGEAEAAAVEALAARLTSEEHTLLARDASLLAAGRPQLLRRYLAATGWEPAAALQLLRATITWRTNGKISACLDANLPGAEEAVATLVTHHRVLLCGFAKDGCPVFLDRSAATDWSALLRVLTPDQIVYAHIQQNEFTQRIVLPFASRRAGHAVTKFVTIMDLRGLAISGLSRRVVLDLLSSVAAVDKHHYPETLAACFLINPPASLSMVLRMVTPLINPATRRKLTNLGSGAKMVAALREALGSDVHLPTSVLTGTKPADMPSSLPDGAGVVDAGACCFEYIADVERNLAAGAAAHTHGHSVLTSLFGGAAEPARAEGAAAKPLARRATFTLVPDTEAPPAPPAKLPSRRMSGETVYHDAETEHEAESTPVAVLSTNDEAKRERFYTQRLVKWAQTAALLEAEEAEQAAAVSAEAAPAIRKKHRCACACFHAKAD